MTTTGKSGQQGTTVAASPAASGYGRRRFLATTGAGAALALGGARAGRAASRAEITFASARFVGRGAVAKVIDAYNQSQGKVHVSYLELPPPAQSTEVHQALVQQLARRSGTPDVFTQDVIWIAEFAGAGWALPLDEHVDQAARGEYYPGVVQACMWQNKLTALPWFIDTGMLYYRTDLLQKAGAEVPTEWSALTELATKLQASGDAKYGWLWQGKQAEVLVCNLVEMIASNGGAILGPDGKEVLVDQDKAVEAVQFMYDTINKSKISPADVLSWDEEPSRRPFTGGEAAFLRNWSYVEAIARDKDQSQVTDRFGVAPLPHFPGGKSSACLGGYQLGVNANSKHKDAAIDFALWMSSPATQLIVASEQGLAPTRPAVLDSADLAKAQPAMTKLKQVFMGATPRPVTPRYPQVTLALQSAVSRALASGDVKTELAAAKTRIAAVVAKS